MHTMTFALVSFTYLSFSLSLPFFSTGLKSIMKKNGVADKQGNKGAKKNLKFVGVNGG